MKLSPHRRPLPLALGAFILLGACEFTQSLPDAPREAILSPGAKPPTIIAAPDGPLPPPGEPFPEVMAAHEDPFADIPLPGAPYAPAPASSLTPPASVLTSEAIALPEPPRETEKVFFREPAMTSAPAPAPLPPLAPAALPQPAPEPEQQIAALQPLGQPVLALPEASAALPEPSSAPGILFDPVPVTVSADPAPAPAIVESRMDPVLLPVTPAPAGPLPDIATLKSAPLPPPRPAALSAAIAAAPAVVPAAIDSEGGSLFVNASDGVALSIAPLTGGQADRLYLIADAAAAQIGARSTRAAYASAPRRFRLEGRASAMARNGEVMLVADWRLRDDQNRVIGDFYEKQSLPYTGAGDPWDALTDDMLLAVGRRSADRLMRSGMLGERMGQFSGDAALASAPRPAPVQPAAIADNTAPLAATSVALTPRPAPRPATRMAPIPNPEPEPQVAPTPAPAPAPQRVAAPAPSFETLSAAQTTAGGQRPIVLRGVFGAPGDGNTALSREINAMLTSAGERFTSDGDPNAFYLAAQVTRNSGASIDQIRIVWRLEDAQGRSIGQVVQENEVPSGALDGQWGEDAAFAAEGAREGLTRLLSEARSVLG